MLAITPKALRETRRDMKFDRCERNGRNDPVALAEGSLSICNGLDSAWLKPTGIKPALFELGGEGVDMKTRPTPYLVPAPRICLPKSSEHLRAAGCVVSRGFIENGCWWSCHRVLHQGPTCAAAITLMMYDCALLRTLLPGAKLPVWPYHNTPIHSTHGPLGLIGSHPDDQARNLVWNISGSVFDSVGESALW